LAVIVAPTQLSYNQYSMKTASFFCTCPKNSSDLLAAEAKEAGANDVQEHANGVLFSGPLETGYRLCLWTRIASKVLLEIAEFDASTADGLYEKMRSVVWSDHMRLGAKFSIRATVTKQGPLSSKFAVLRTKDAIVDFFRDTTGGQSGARPDRRR
jgi:23S rRNA (guanine2445-N2)-methyltransferase / 23S rRNA (guanine2069-N7)-methyltransferase